MERVSEQRVEVVPSGDEGYDGLIELWEASVRTSHGFLTEGDIQEIREALPKYLSEMDIYVCKEGARTVGFLGIAGKKIEALFVHPDAQGKGYGTALLDYAVDECGCEYVDVNEQNDRAAEFYRRNDFRCVGRDGTDAEGREFPIVHLKYLPFQFINTERLALRPFCEGDLERLYECCRNQKLGDNAGWRPHRSLDESREVLDRVFLNKYDTWAITERGDEANLIGTVGLIADPMRNNMHAAMVGYWLDECQWGKGYMQEAVRAVLDYAFGERELSLVSGYCYVHNSRSQRVLERCGFRKEGVLAQAEVTYDNRVLDVVCYCITKEEYNQIR